MINRHEENNDALVVKEFTQRLLQCKAQKAETKKFLREIKKGMREIRGILRTHKKRLKKKKIKLKRP